MTEMIERVARAICASECEGSTYKPEVVFRISEDDYMRSAKAAIEAMRTPTEEMLAAAAKEKLYDRQEIAVLKGPARQRAKMIVRFQAMIDEAQK